MNSVKAAQPEIIRSHQKDEFFQVNLRNEVSRIVIDWFGTQRWIKYQKELSIMADIAYFCLTTLSGFQTLGEEYCNLVQIDQNKMKIPSLLRRSIMILLQCFAPYLLEKGICYLKSLLHHNFRDDERYSLIENALDVILQSLSVLSRVHLAVFYLQGMFYALGKRMTGIRYVLLRDFLKDSSAKESYKFLGKLFLLQFIILSPYYLLQFFKKATYRKEEAKLSTETDVYIKENTKQVVTKSRSKHNCPLCLEPIVDATTTLCGHLFCWNCIVCWCANKLECPVCRDEVIPAKLIYLCHFEM
ncbi:peroxisome biogenesis factor 10-like [Rhopilema esculentum]|uniref:peroxisome biogenesis factor 10-like n=1 Tax=Rhopilema esculentum TaxID=499914 RepID=UPI0031DA5C05